MSDSPNRNIRWVLFALLILALGTVFLQMVKSATPKSELRVVEGYTDWSKETLAIAETLPLQDGGRIKPFSTYANFSMLQLRGDRKMEVKASEAGDKITIKPTAWLLDCLFRPQYAAQMPTFRIDNSSVLEAIGVKATAKRDRYSYDAIKEGRVKLFELAESYAKIDDKKRDPLQSQLVVLAGNVRYFEGLIGHFGFARNGVALTESAGPGTAIKATSLSTVVATAPVIQQVAREAAAQGKPTPAHVQSMLEQVATLAQFAGTNLFVMPPADKAQTKWSNAGEIIAEAVFQGIRDPQAAAEELRKFETLANSIHQGEPAFRDELKKFSDETVRSAKDRGEYRSVKMEAHYYRANWFLNAMVFFLLGVVCTFVMGFTGKSLVGRLAAAGVWASTLAGIALCAVAIVERCWIMQRPPVGNLYDTIIFICTVLVSLLLLVEYFTRYRLALGVAPVIGTLLIVFARRYELFDAKDHMDPLVAVLDSNYWLTIHVITITMGYASGLLAALLSHLYVFIRGLGLDNHDRAIQRTLTRASYGAVCLTLFLSLVGTVLGGIWANDSWGRFWGWDPKENGALLIVLWNLAILHARLGGYLKEWAFHLVVALGACIVGFSWWHVNFLSTGLHNYGFTSGKGYINSFYLAELGVLAFGAIAWTLEESKKKLKTETLKS